MATNSMDIYRNTALTYCAVMTSIYNTTNNRVKRLVLLYINS